MRDEANGLNKRKDQRKKSTSSSWLCWQIMNSGLMTSTLGLRGAKKKERKAVRKKARTVFLSPHTHCWLVVSH